MRKSGSDENTSPFADEKDVTRLFRLARANPPVVADFLSLAALGKPVPFGDPAAASRWDSLSLFESAEYCRRLAHNPRHARRQRWQYIYMLALPHGVFRIEKTGGEGHWSVWGDAETVMAYIVGVEEL